MAQQTDAASSKPSSNEENSSGVAIGALAWARFATSASTSSVRVYVQNRRLRKAGVVMV